MYNRAHSWCCADYDKCFNNRYLPLWGFPCSGKESACNAGKVGSISGLERSPGVGNGNPLQYSCLENPMDRGAWWAIVHRVAESDTSESTEHAYIYRYGIIQNYFTA